MPGERPPALAALQVRNFAESDREVLRIPASRVPPYFIRSMSPTCIVAAQEHVLTRALKRVLDPEFEVVAMIDNVVSLDASIKSLQPSLMIVDLHMLGADADRVLRVLLDRAGCPPLIGLSSDDKTVVTAEELGLAAIVTRSSAAHDLLPVVREVLSRGKRRHQPEV